MGILWGCLIATIGFFMIKCASTKSEFVIYRLLVARSRILWGEKVHRFHQVAGAMIIVFGALVALGFI